MKLLALSLAAAGPAVAATADATPPSFVAVNLLQLSGSYAINVSIGTPPQSLLCALDSGSSDLWVMSSAMADTGEHNLFNPNTSATYEATGSDVKLDVSAEDILDKCIRREGGSASAVEGNVGIGLEVWRFVIQCSLEKGAGCGAAENQRRHRLPPSTSLNEIFGLPAAILCGFSSLPSAVPHE